MERWGGWRRGRWNVTERKGPRRPEGLSPREMDVLREMARGLSNSEIAKKLFISPHTVKNHITAIYRKMGMDDRTRVVLTAIRTGLVSLEPPSRDEE